jgi:hypothetical protein
LRRLALGRQPQRGRRQLVDLAQNALGGLIQRLARGVVKQRLGDAGAFELLRQVGIQLLAGESFQMVVHTDALAQRFVHLEREGAAQQRLAEEQQRQVAGGIHVEVQQQREFFERRMRQQVRFVADENRVLLLALVQPQDGFGDLAAQIAAPARRFQVQLQRHLAQQVQRRAGGEVHVQDLVQVGIERGGEDARGGGLAGTHFAGDQAHAVMLGQELQPCFDLVPALGGEQLFGLGTVGEGRFLEAEKRFPHG